MTSYTKKRLQLKAAMLGLALLGAGASLAAQDTLWLVNGDHIRCRVKSVNRVDVDYIPWGQSGPLYSVNKGILLRLVYETGSTVVFQNTPVPAVREDASFSDSAFSAMGNDAIVRKAIGDAEANYDFTRPRNAAVVIGLTSPIVYLLPGIVATAAMAATPPRYDYLNVPDESAFRNSTVYRQTYIQKAKKIKARKVWGGYLTGAGITVGGLLAIGLLLF